MYLIRVVLIAVLSLGVTAGAAYLALRRSNREDPEKTRIELLVRNLGDRNPDVRRNAESELRRFGPKAAEALREAGRSSNPAVAERAKKLLTEIGKPSDSVGKTDRPPERRPEETKNSPPEGAGVQVDISLSQENFRGIPRFYVRLVNRDAAPYVVLRDRAHGRFYYGRFARFEIVDAQGKTVVVPADVLPPSTAAKPEAVVLSSGESLDLYAGQDDSMTGIGATLEPGSYSLRFLYDASSEGAYRRVLLTASGGGVPLPPMVLASAAVRFTVAN